VLGAAGGGRDKWKRKEFGKIAGSSCDDIVLTSEDPFDENEEDIIGEIRNGILETKFSPQNIHVELDRKKAITYAIANAHKGDVVIATGKGSEEWIRIGGGKKIPWNERKVFEEELKK
jgi:UDP-N-acetylmuramoyl-L-alanyl-D-glutamate--2,6-diaminopimelate ligase